MQIPKQFTLGGMKWSVEQLDVIPGAMGACSNQEAKIVLLASLPKQVKEQTYCHELVHAILFSMGRPADQHDEVFVDAFGTFLHQYLSK